MDLEALSQIGEFVGGLVVVISVFYVALQVRHNVEALRTENYGRVLDRISTIQARLSTDLEFSATFSRGVADTEVLSPAERVRVAWAFYEMFGNFEFIFLQYRRGALPEEVWERWSTTVEWWLSFPGIRTWWRTKPTPFSANFTAFVEDVIGRVPLRTDGGGPWRSFVHRGVDFATIREPGGARSTPEA